MQKRAYGAVALAGVATLLMSACGSGSTPTAPAATDAGAATTSATTTAAASATTTAAPVRDANVDLVIWCDNDRKAILDKYATQFGQEQGIKVAVQVSNDTRKDFKDATNVGKGPDVIVGAHDWLGELVQNGAVSPVQLSADQQGKFTKASIQAAKYNGQLYGVPYATENLGLMRNTALAPDAPASYEDLVTKGKQLVADGKATNALLQQVSKTGDAYYTYPYMKAFGGGIFGTKDNGDYDPTKVLVGSDGSIKGLTYLGQLGKDNILSTNVDFDTAQSLFSTGKVALLRHRPVGRRQGQGLRHQVRHLAAADPRGQQGHPVPRRADVLRLGQGQERRLRAGVRHQLRDQARAPGRHVQHRPPPAGPAGGARQGLGDATPTSRRGPTPARVRRRCRTSRP